MADSFSYEDASVTSFSYEDAGGSAPKTGGLRKLADIGVSFAGGAVGATKAIADAGGAGNAVSRRLDGAQDGVQSLLSPARQAEKAARAQTIADAEKSGSVLRELGAHLGGFAEAPVSTVAEAAGSVVPVVGAMLTPAGRSAAGRRLLGVGLGAAQGAGAVKGSIYDAVKQEHVAQGATSEAAQHAADRAQAYVGPNTGSIALGAGLGAVAGTSGVEGVVSRAMAGRAAAGGASMARRAAVGAVAEGVPEAVQGGQERLASNLAMQGEGFDTPTWRGVAGQAAAEGLAGGVLGGGVNAASRGHTRAIASSVGQGDQSEVAEQQPGGAPGVPASQPPFSDARGNAGMAPADPNGISSEFRTAGPEGQTLYANERGNVGPAPNAAPAAAPIDPTAGPLSRAASKVGIPAAAAGQLSPDEVRAFNNAYRREVPAPLEELQQSVRSETAYMTPADALDVRQSMEDAWLQANVADEPVNTADDAAAPVGEPDAFIEQAIAQTDAKVRDRRILSALQNLVDEPVNGTAAALQYLDASLSRVGEAVLSGPERERVQRMMGALAAFTGRTDAAPLPGFVEPPVDAGADNAAMEALIPERGQSAGRAAARAAVRVPRAWPQRDEVAETPPTVARPTTWRSNAIAANKVARELGLNPKGKRLAAIVGEIDAADAARAGRPHTASDMSAGPIAGEWSAFAAETGTLGIPRAQMPQIKSGHRGALVNFLKARGITGRSQELPAADLKPTQAEFSPERVERARQRQGGDRSILISSDGYVVDGHHQWLAKRADGLPVNVIRLNAPIRQVLGQVAEFPSTTADGVGQEAQAGLATPGGGPEMAPGPELPTTTAARAEGAAPASAPASSSGSSSLSVADRMDLLEASAADADARAADWSGREYWPNSTPLPQYEATGGPVDVQEANEQRRLKAVMDARAAAASARAEADALFQQGNVEAQLASQFPDGEQRAQVIAREGAARRTELREAGERWDGMTAAQRQALVQDVAGLNALAKKSAPTRAWDDLSEKVRGQLADAMQPPPAQRESALGVAETGPSSYIDDYGRAQEPTQPDDGRGPATGPAESATADGVRGAGGSVPRRTATLVGLGIADRIERVGSQALLGQRVDTAERLAELAQVYRDPRFETFRVFFLKSDEVVHATGVSARMPGEAPMVPAGMTFEEYLAEFQGAMQRTGADGYYILHNHPSGNPTPSNADLSLTEELARRVPGMRAHVVINSGKYAVIEPTDTRVPAASMVNVKDFGEDLLLKASKPTAALGAKIAGPDDLASIGKSMQKPGWITLVGTGSNGMVRAISEAPASILTRSYPYLAGTVRRFMRQSGSASVFAVGEAGDIGSKPVRSALQAGILRDALPDAGLSLAQQGAASGGPGFKTKGRVVAETVLAADLAAAGAAGEPAGLARFRTQGDNPTSQRVGAALKGMTATNLKQQAGFKATDYMPIGLQLLGRRQLVDVYGELLPQLSTYSDLMARMDADKNEAGAGADQLATAWGKLPDERQLAELMHDATLAQIDPAKDFVIGDNKADWMRLRAQHQALSPAAKDVYARTRDTYSKHMQDVRSAIKERIDRSEIGGQRKAEMLKRMDDEFFGHTKGVYFPLARFGQYVVVVKDANGKTVNVSRAETMGEAHATRQQLQTPFPASKGFTVGKVLKAKEFVADRDAVGRGFMEQLYGVLDKQGMDRQQKAELEDALGQLYLSALPDLSWAKHGIHRKGTPGFSQDARRAFAQNVFHGASYLAKLRYSDQLQDQLSEMDKHVSVRNSVVGYDSVRARQVLDEMNKRHESAMNPKSNSLSTGLTSLGFIYFLGLSPASAMVNLTQTALVAYPVMGARWGYGKASAALMKASQQAVRGKNDITAALNADEKAAFDEAVRSGVIDVTMAHDLAGVAQGEDMGVMWKLRPVMKWASFLFHHAEKFNRQITFVAAYRLARETGAESTKAYADAVQATYDGHFDYSANNRPRVMQGNAARVLLLFKQYSQNMVYTLARSAQQSLKGATPQERAEARKTLGGLLVMHGLAAGALGLPMVTTLLAAASMLGGDDDEPWDAQIALQNVLADTFGQKPAEVLAHGLSRLTPWDISGRVGLDRLIFPDIQEGLEGQRLGESAMAAALGPVAGIGINALKGLQDMGEGRYLRGLEGMMPTALRSPLKAWRYGVEGVRDKSGIVVQDEVGAAELLGQASGFSPSSVRNSFEGKSAIVQHDRALQARRSTLVEQFAMAAMSGDEEGKADTRADIAKFNEKNPGRRILPLQLAQSVRMRTKRIEQAQDGVYLPAKRREAMEAGRFATGQ